MLYGAYGFTGRLIVAEALNRGHRPLLAGRNVEKLAALAEPYGLAWTPVRLDDTAALHDAVGRCELVLHAAGPFIHTAAPMVEACLATGTHYIDITGELSVFQDIYAQHDMALKRRVALMPGTGLDIVPTDCLARYVAEQVPRATNLETAVVGSGAISGGTARSAVEMLGHQTGGLVRRDDQLRSEPLGARRRRVTFSDGRVRELLSAPWADLVSAAQTTGIPNITCFLDLPLPRGSERLAQLASHALGWEPLRRAAAPLVARLFGGPDAAQQRHARSYFWARVSDDRGQAAEVWLESIEAYRLTAVTSLLCVERILAEQPAGALTPAGAFGADLILSVDGTRRFDALPGVA